MTTVVSEKGQVTIPKPLRDRLGIEPGQVLDFTEEDGLLVGRKVHDRGPVDTVYGILEVSVDVVHGGSGPVGTDALIDELRGPALLP